MSDRCPLGYLSDFRKTFEAEFQLYLYVLYIKTSPSAENREKFESVGRLFLPSRPLTCFLAILIVGVLFPFGVLGRMWNSIVSVPDHCLFIYFVLNTGISVQYES